MAISRTTRLRSQLLVGKSRGSVVAERTDLDGWLTASPVPFRSFPNLARVVCRANKLRADFLQIDSQIALTFSGMALDASDTEKKKRTTLLARKAYNAITRLRMDTDLGDMEKNRLDFKMERLKRELQSLGETFWSVP